MRRPTPTLPARPARVDQPAVDVMSPDQIAQQIAVDGRMQRHERRAETGRERRLRLDDALLRARNLGRISGQEMIHRLRRIELGDRRQDAEGIAGQHDDVLRVARAPGRRGVGDEMQGIGDAGVFGLAIVVEIGDAQSGSSATFSITVPKRSVVA